MPQAMEMLHTQDPREAIWADLGPYLEGLEPLGDRVLLAVYERSKHGGSEAKTKGGIILTNKTTDEDKYQGKACLVLKKGPLAFREDETHTWGGMTVNVGDWVLINVGESQSFELGKTRCRFVYDVNIQAIIPSPDKVW